MLNAKQIESFIQFPQPLLTAYLNTRGSEPSRHPPVPESLVWLKQESKLIGRALSAPERDLFQQQVERIMDFLDKRPPREEAIVIFAGAKAWQLVPLHVPVANELRWGRPAVSQLLWLVDEHRSYFVVVVDHKGAHFFRYQLCELLRTGEKAFDVDISAWKKKDIGHIAGQETQKTRGSQREVFQRRIDAQYAHLCAETAKRAAALFKEYNCAAIILIGEDRLSQSIEAVIPREIVPQVSTIQEDLAGLTDCELEKRLKPIVEELEHNQQAAIVSEFLESNQGTVTGIEKSLFQLQQGSVRKLLLTRELDADLQQCLKCGWVERTADPQCSACGGEKLTVTLREVLPDLVKLHKAGLEIVSGEAASLFRKSGGMGGWLRGSMLAVAR